MNSFTVSHTAPGDFERETTVVGGSVGDMPGAIGRAFPGRKIVSVRRNEDSVILGFPVRRARVVLVEIRHPEGMPDSSRILTFRDASSQFDFRVVKKDLEFFKIGKTYQWIIAPISEYDDAPHFSEKP